MLKVFSKIRKYSLIPMVVFIMASSSAAFAETSAEAVSGDKKEEVQEVARGGTMPPTMTAAITSKLPLAKAAVPNT